MRIYEFENLCRDENTLDKALEMLHDDFVRVDEYAEMAKSSVFNNAESIKKALIELSGVFANLKTASAVIETVKKNKELRKYHELKMSCEKGDTKFVSTSAEKDASYHVSLERRVRNVVNGYVDAAEKSITALQSILKDEMRERNQKQE